MIQIFILPVSFKILFPTVGKLVSHEKKFSSVTHQVLYRVDFVNAARRNFNTN